MIRTLAFPSLLALLAFGWALAATPKPAALSFRVQQLHHDNNEGCAVGDLNNDGKLDVVAGENWFAAPDFTKQRLRKLLPFGKDYLQNNGDHLRDMNGDGRINTADIHALGPREAREIFIEHYFYGPRIDELPEPLHSTVFDAYVNKGANAVRILQRLLNNRVPLTPSRQLRSLNRVRLDERVQLLLITPPPTKVVERNLCALNITNNRIPPLRQLHSPSGNRAAKQFRLPKLRLRQLESLTPRTNRHGIPHLCLNLNNV